jgi:GNAT superfamily N-acetyltransferase
MPTQPAPFRIERATEADAQQVLAFIHKLAEYERMSDAVVATEEGVRTLLFGPRPAAEVVIAWEGAQAIGFALFFETFSTFLGKRGLYLEDLFVLPEHRRRGVGRALLSHLARLAVERQCGRFEWCVLDWNEPAIAFYRSLGAEVLDTWRICRLTGKPLAELGAPQGRRRRVDDRRSCGRRFFHRPNCPGHRPPPRYLPCRSASK